MKMTKRILSVALCLVLMLALALPAMAAEPYTLTINNAKDGHIYEAYQIFKGDLVDVDGKDVLSNIKWGDSMKDTDDLMDELETAFPGLVVVDSNGKRLYEDSAAGVAEYLADNVTNDSESLDLFAEVVGKYLDAGKVAGTSTDNGDTYEISGLGAGYYLVKDQDGSLNKDTDGDGNPDTVYDFYTKYIIRILKNETVTPKGEVPEVNKTINDTLGGTYTESEDFNINDTAYYKWEGTLPSNLKSYDTYYYKFIDTLPTGLDFLAIQQVYLEGHGGNLVTTFYDITDENDANDTFPTGITLNVDGQNVTLEFADLLTLYPNILETHKIIVKYTARVNRDALVAQAMTNSVKVEFSNNPNGTGEGNTGTTPEDVAHAFTFRIDVDKYDADQPTKKLGGAEFVLYYQKTENDQNVKYYAQVVTEEMIAAGEAVNGKKVEQKDLGVVYGWVADRTKASILDTDETGKLGVKGMDEGVYYLEETNPPAGYNLMETPVQIKIIPTYAADGTLESVLYEVDSISQGNSTTVGVRNSSGSTLPMTGGVGTTMFYVVGGILIAAAVVILISRRRVEE